MKAIGETATMASSLARVAKGNICAGCGLCGSLSQGAVEMVVSEDGYIRPHQHGRLNPETDQLIAETCPGLSLSQSSKEGSDHLLWGPFISASSGASTDQRLRHHAASGGALSALLICLLETNRVDRVVQIAASPDNPLENTVVTSFNREDIYRAAGAR